MATIGNLGAANSGQIIRKNETGDSLPRKNSAKPKQPDNFRATRIAAELRRLEEAQKSRDSSNGRVMANEKNQEQKQRMSLDELAEMLRKVNLTFDVFEIQAQFSVDDRTGDVSIKVINQRTGEVIRKIPPYDVPKFAEALKNGEAAVTDLLV